MEYKTPGVYIEEVSTFPPSVVAVPTAIPAFIGYTQSASAPNGDALTGIPTRITSILEYRLLFGARFQADNYLVTLNGTGAATEVAAVQARDTNNNARRYYLYDAVELFYQNGGGPCYIVSVGNYENEIDDQDLENGINAVETVDEPTLLLFPDAVELLDGNNPDLTNMGRLQALALAQCEAR
ncbi:MAG: phage tail protein, partial [Bacteroidota bacterium]